jgi:hypothetical protein
VHSCCACRSTVGDSDWLMIMIGREPQWEGATHIPEAYVSIQCIDLPLQLKYIPGGGINTGVGFQRGRASLY